jgi:CheY-like chemotaxis protein
MGRRGSNGLRRRSVRVLVANAPLSYREAIAEALRTLRPDADVLEAEPEELDRATRTHEPDVVLCSRLTPAVQTMVSAWVLLYPDYEPVAMICAQGELSTIHEIDLDELVSLIDRVEADLDSDDGVSS